MAWKVCSRQDLRFLDIDAVAAGSQGAGRGSEAATLAGSRLGFGGLAGAAADRAAAGRFRPRISSHTHTGPAMAAMTRSNPMTML